MQMNLQVEKHIDAHKPINISQTDSSQHRIIPASTKRPGCVRTSVHFFITRQEQRRKTQSYLQHG